MQWVLGEVCIVWEGVTQKKLRFGLWNCRIECFLPYLVAHGNREHRCVRSDETQSREKYNQGRKEGLCKINLPHEFQKFTFKCRFSCDFLIMAPMLFDLLFNAFSFPLQEKKPSKFTVMLSHERSARLVKEIERRPSYAVPMPDI